MSNFTIDVVIHADPALMGLLSRLGEQRSPEARINPPAPAAQIPQTAPAAGIPVTPSATDTVQNLPAVPTSVPQYTFDMIQTACAECMLSLIHISPCVAFDNVYGKVFAQYQWIRDLPYLEIAESPEQLSDKLDRVLKAQTPEYTRKPLEDKYSELANAFRV